MSRGDLRVEDSCLVQNSQFVVPLSLHSQILQQAHIGHPGATRMTCLLHDSCWWPSLSNQVQQLVAHCQSCRSSEKSPPPVDMENQPRSQEKCSPQEEVEYALADRKLDSTPEPSTCWTKIGMDIAGPFADAPKQQHYIVTIVDYASNYSEWLLTSYFRSVSLIRWVEVLFSRHRSPGQ